jgi:hypothetical protein
MPRLFGAQATAFCVEQIELACCPFGIDGVGSWADNVRASHYEAECVPTFKARRSWRAFSCAATASVARADAQAFPYLSGTLVPSENSIHLDSQRAPESSHHEA